LSCSLLPAPVNQTIHNPAGFAVSVLESVIVMKQMANRHIDRTHLRDRSGVGLIDPSGLPKLPPPPLADRLEQILDTPDA
jgi:hypothetical protein